MGLGPLGVGELAIQCCSQFGEFEGEFERWLTGVQCKQMSKKGTRAGGKFGIDRRFSVGITKCTGLGTRQPNPILHFSSQSLAFHLHFVYWIVHRVPSADTVTFYRSYYAGSHNNWH